MSSQRSHYHQNLSTDKAVSAFISVTCPIFVRFYAFFLLSVSHLYRETDKTDSNTPYKEGLALTSLNLTSFESEVYDIVLYRFICESDDTNDARRCMYTLGFGWKAYCMNRNNVFLSCGPEEGNSYFYGFGRGS